MYNFISPKKYLQNFFKKIFIINQLYKISLSEYFVIRQKKRTTQTKDLEILVFIIRLFSTIKYLTTAFSCHQLIN